MTLLHYEGEDKDGKKFSVKTLAQAKALTQDGGSYHIIYTEQLSTSEAYCRFNARRAGDLR